MNPVLESLFKHKSIRKYKDQPLEDEKLQLIIKAAQAAPNWCNGQQVSIIVIKDKELRKKLRLVVGVNLILLHVQHSWFFVLIFIE